MTLLACALLMACGDAESRDTATGGEPADLASATDRSGTPSAAPDAPTPAAPAETEDTIDPRDREPVAGSTEASDPASAEAPPDSDEEHWRDFGIWDDDADIRISRREFLRGVDRTYPMWTRFDADDDGSVSRGELVNGLHRVWRETGSLTRAETRAGAGRWFDVDWSTETIAGTGPVSRRELGRFLDRRGVLEALDRDGDGALNQFELGLAFFEHWDLNDDGFIDEVEWITA